MPATKDRARSPNPGVPFQVSANEAMVKVAGTVVLAVVCECARPAEAGYCCYYCCYSYY